MKPKVLVIATSAKSRGGIATVVSAFRNTDVWTEYNCRWIESHIDGGKLRKFWKFSKAFFVCVFLLFKYQIIHIHVSTRVSANRKYFFYRLAKLYRRKIIIHLHCGSQLFDIWNSKYEDMFNGADRCLVLSQSIKDIIVSRIGREDNVEVLYNPCPIVDEQPSYLAREKKILFAATLYKEKGYLDLIEAFAKVHAKHLEWQLILAGNGDQTEGLTLSRNLGVAERVKFLGWVSGEAKAREFSTASIFCLPSYAEGFPMAVLDAWAYGLPVITTPVGGIPDIVIDGDNGLLFTPGDVDGLANRLSTLIENGDLRSELSEKAISLASTIFNIDTIASQLKRVYNNIF